MKSKLVLATAVLSTMSFLTNCKKVEKSVEPQSSIQQNENGKIELFPNAKVVSENDSKLLTSVQENKLVFNGNSEFLNSMKVGDILIASVSEIAPDGYLRVVNSIEKSGGSYTFITSNSSLEKAVKNGNIHVEFPVMFNANEGIDNGKTTGYSGTTSKTIPLNRVLYDKDGNQSTDYDQVSTQGSLVLSAYMSVDMNFSWGSLTYFDAKTTFGASNSQTLTIGGTFSLPQKTVKIYNNSTIPSVNFVVGGVPVNIKPVVDVYVDYGGSITAQAKFGYKGNTTISPEVKYQSGAWTTVAPRSLSLVGYKPNVNLNANFNASIRPRITFSLYGCQSCASAYLEASVYGKLACSLFPNVSKNIVAGFSVSAGANLFGYHKDYPVFLNYQWNL